MTEARYNITISREGQPAHQMAQMSATVPGNVLMAMVRAIIEGPDGEGMAGWLAEDETVPFNFGTLKSLTITPEI